MFNSIVLVRFSWLFLISILCVRMIKMNEFILVWYGGFSKYWYMEVLESNLLLWEGVWGILDLCSLGFDVLDKCDIWYLWFGLGFYMFNY